MTKSENNKIELIPIDDITVVNPRERGIKKFRQIVSNISNIGLKKPITVTRKPSSPHKFLLVCGQGRYEAYKSIGESKIPAIVVDVPEDKLLLMSLVENLARRNPSCLEMVREIGTLKERGYSFGEIAKKTDLTVSYIRGIVKLLQRGEERLIMAVERGQIPVSVAMTIALADDHDLQRALTDAYESNNLRGKKLLATRRLIEKRQTDGKSLRSGTKRSKASVSGKQLLQAYQEESRKQRLVINRAKLCENRLLFLVAAMRQLLDDKHFVSLLRAEGLDIMPAYLLNELKSSGSSQ
jgi:ParB family chromosome partitioning protein